MKYTTTWVVILIIIIIILYTFKNNTLYFENVRNFRQLANNTTPMQGETINAPVVFPVQLYQYIPYARDVGKPCEGGCGALGTCENGICKLKNYNKTVFDVSLV